jgi:hypothetical protein
MDISLHNCKSIKIRMHMPNNHNAIVLRIEREDGPLDLTLYGLPETTTNSLIEALGKPSLVSALSPKHMIKD